MKLSQFKDTLKNLFNLSDTPTLDFWPSKNHEGMFTAQFDTGIANEDFNPEMEESNTNRRTIVIGVNTSEQKFDAAKFQAEPSNSWVYKHPKSDKTNPKYNKNYKNLYIISTSAPKAAAFSA